MNIELVRGKRYIVVKEGITSVGVLSHIELVRPSGDNRSIDFTESCLELTKRAYGGPYISTIYGPWDHIEQLID